MTVKDAADIIGCHRRHVRYLIDHGRLTATRVISGPFSYWDIEVADIEEYKKIYPTLKGARKWSKNRKRTYTYCMHCRRKLHDKVDVYNKWACGSCIDLPLHRAVMLARIVSKKPCITIDMKSIYLCGEGMVNPESYSEEIREEFAKIEAILLPDGTILT